MNTVSLPPAIRLCSPWHRRWRDALSERVAAWRLTRAQRLALRDVCELSDEMLADVGAPEEWLGAAAACRTRAMQERELLRQGLVPGAGW